MIGRIIHWLSEHRSVNLALVVGYAVFIVFAHEWFVNLSVEVMNSLSLPVYNKVVASIAVVALLFVVYLMYRGFRQRTAIDKVGLGFLALTLVGLVIHFFVLTEMNIEFIHAIEFGLLAMLIYPLVGRFGGAIAFSLPVMLFDEWHQYQVLFDYVEYFELNDVVLDLLGAGLFVSLLKMFNQGVNSASTAFFQRAEVYLLLVLIIGVVAAMMFGWVVPYEETASENTWLVLNAIKEPHGFWRVHPLIGSTYHVLEPISGLIAVFAIGTIYLFMDSSKPAK
ncbi:MAG: hypothetical protein GC178_08340 [Flavobacteriales bacterium]|nr:hypothetical protein [Flavobacteriales bacterium]